MRLLKYLLRDLLNNRRFVFLFIFNLSLGLAGFIALDGFKVSLDQTIKKRSKTILGADFGVSSRRQIKANEREFIKAAALQNVDESELIEIYSMIANSQRNSRLIQIKAIQENYPFYGEIILREKGKVNLKAHKILAADHKIWVYPEILQQLKVNIGDTLYIGEKKFVIDDVVDRDSAAGISTNMAPRLYMNLNNLSETGLVKPGSLAWYSFVYRLPGLNSEALGILRDQIFKKIDNPDVRVYTHENASEQMARLLSRLNDFLGLATLVALFLAALGTGFLFRAYLKSKIKEVAILICLGATHTSAFMQYFIQIFVLGLASSILATLLSLLIVPGLGAITQGILPFPVEFIIRPSTILLGLVIGTFGSILICLPILADLGQLKPSLLFVDSYNQNVQMNKRWKTIFSAVPAVILFWALSIWLSNSAVIGSLFCFIFFSSGALLALVSWLIFTKLNYFQKIPYLSLRWALRDLARHKMTTLACFISIGLGMLLLNLIPQLQLSLDKELQTPEKSKVPSLFMFDIQEDQLVDIQKIMKNEKVELSQLSPMVRARLVAVNDLPFDKGVGASAESLSRAEQGEMRFRNRGFNLSFRAKMISSERLIRGQAFRGVYRDGSDKLPEISLEKRFADRLKLRIGDKLDFEIESVPISGRVVNFRSVNWTSFQPNFFIQFQPGSLDLAPKTYIATLPSLSSQQKLQIQDRIVEELPNVSLIDVSRLVERLRRIMEQMAWALGFMAILCLLAGFVVIYSIANHQANNRKWDIGLLKSLGASFSIIRAQLLWQFACISLFAGVFGAAISLFVSFLISNILFEGLWVFDAQTPLISISICVLMTVFISDIATRSALKTRTRELFSF